MEGVEATKDTITQFSREEHTGDGGYDTDKREKKKKKTDEFETIPSARRCQ